MTFRYWLLWLLWIHLPLGVVYAQSPAVNRLEFIYLGHPAERLPALSNLELPPANLGAAGAELGVADNNTTGRFLKQKYDLQSVILSEQQQPADAYRKLVKQHPTAVFILNLNADDLIGIADLPESKNRLLFNVGSRDDRLRTKDCRQNVFHIIPERQMAADALTQYLMTKKWREWVIVQGKRPADALFVNALEAAAKKFGATIIEKKRWDFGPDTRRIAQAEIPLFSRSFKTGLMAVADEIGEFGEYLAYRTERPMLVFGTQGLIAVAWHKAHEQWGAAQLQSRFSEQFKRYMQEEDYTAWLAVRAAGEAFTRSKSHNADTLRKSMLAADFAVAGFKGVKLTFRPWSQQLRQPILLATPTSLVSVSPQEQYLHRYSQLDTLGHDRSPKNCNLNP